VSENTSTTAGPGSTQASPSTGSTGPTAEPAPLLVGVPDGGGLREAFAGLAALRVPSPRSVLVSAASLVLLLVSLTLFVVGVDAVLGATLTGGRLRLAPVAGAVGLLAAVGSLALLLGTALDGPTQPRLHLERHPRRLAAGSALLVVAAVCAVLWMRGIAAG
jgi:hypothetical protein